MSVVTIISLYLGVQVYTRISASSSPANSSKKFNRLRLGYLILALSLIVLEMTRNATVNDHPIDVLMFDANVYHNRWLKQANESKNYKEAVRIYRKRYNAWPPP